MNPLTCMWVCVVAVSLEEGDALNCCGYVAVGFLFDSWVGCWGVQVKKYPLSSNCPKFG